MDLQELHYFFGSFVWNKHKQVPYASAYVTLDTMQHSYLADVYKNQHVLDSSLLVVAETPVTTNNTQVISNHGCELEAQQHILTKVCNVAVDAGCFRVIFHTKYRSIEAVWDNYISPYVYTTTRKYKPNTYIERLFGKVEPRDRIQYLANNDLVQQIADLIVTLWLMNKHLSFDISFIRDFDADRKIAHFVDKEALRIVMERLGHRRFNKKTMVSLAEESHQTTNVVHLRKQSGLRN